MKGLILKDLLNLKSTFKMLGAMIVFFAVAFLREGNSFVFGIIILMFAMMVVTTISYDDLAKWDAYTSESGEDDDFSAALESLIDNKGEAKAIKELAAAIKTSGQGEAAQSDILDDEIADEIANMFEEAGIALSMFQAFVRTNSAVPTGEPLEEWRPKHAGGVVG